MSAESQLSFSLLEDYDSYRIEWLAEAQKDQEYFNNNQWTEDEVAILEERQQVPLVVNRLTPVLLQKIAILHQHRPTLRAFPSSSPMDAARAEAANHALQYILQYNDFPLIDLQVKREHVIRGLGFYYVYYDSMLDDGRGEVIIREIPPNLVWVDPLSRKIDFSDAQHILISQEVTVAQAKLRFPDKARSIQRWSTKRAASVVVDDPSTESHTEDGTMDRARVGGPALIGDDVVRIIERYSKRSYRYWSVTNALTGFYYDTVSDAAWEGLYKNDVTKNGTPFWRTLIYKVITLEDALTLAEEVMPISEYPIVPVCNIHTGTPYPMGDARPIRGMQDELNKRRQLLILNAALTSSNKWLAQQGSIDRDMWERTSTVPNVVLEYRLGFEKPEAIMPAPLPQAFAHLEAEAKYDIEYAAGVWAMNQGSSADAPQTYRATLALEEFSNRRLGPQLETFAHAKRKVGKIALQLAQHYWKAPKFMRIMGEDGQPNELTINQIKVAADGKQYVDNALEAVQYDIFIVSGMTAPTSQAAREERAQSLYEVGIFDRQAVIEQLDVPNKEKLLARLGEQAQLQAQLEASRDEIGQLTGLLQTMRRQNIQAGIRAVEAEYRALEKGKLLDTETKLRLTAELERLQAQEHQMTMQLIEDRAKMEAEFATREARLQAKSQAAARTRNGAASRKDR